MKKVTVIFRHDLESWSAKSPDIPRYTAVADSYDELRELVIEGLPFFLGEPAEIIEVIDGPEQVRSA
jgi:hypothetical protein